MKRWEALCLLALPVVAASCATKVETAGRAAVEGVELEYQTRGAGEPDVLVHAGIFADWYQPLLQEPA